MKARRIGNQGTKWTTKEWPGKNPKPWDGHIVPNGDLDALREAAKEMGYVVLEDAVSVINAYLAKGCSG